MKAHKIFALLLALVMLCLTACGTKKGRNYEGS